jgi:hypothetical protein
VIPEHQGGDYETLTVRPREARYRPRGKGA